MKKAIAYGLAAAVIAATLTYALVPVGPDRIEYKSTKGTGTALVDETYLMTRDVVTIGRNADVAVKDGSVTASVVVTLTRSAGKDGANVWTLAVTDTSSTVSVNGSVVKTGTLADGDSIGFGGAKVTYGVGRAGLAGLGDRWESNTLTHLYFSPAIMAGAFPIIMSAFPASLGFGVIAFVLAIPFGLSLAFMKMAKTRVVRWPATAYIDVVRGTPLFLQILIVFFGLPLMPFYQDILQANPWLNNAGPVGISYSYWARGLVVLSLNSGAYMSEIFRAGIQSIHRGQIEAAHSLGMSTPKAMAWVILPQTVRRILPTMMSEFILLFKDTALLAAVGVAEMALRAREVAANKFNASSYVLAAMFYLVVTIPLGRFVANLEARLAESEGGGGMQPPPKVILLADGPVVMAAPDARSAASHEGR